MLSVVAATKVLHNITGHLKMPFDTLFQLDPKGICAKPDDHGKPR